MPKPKIDDWRTATPQTALQRGAFLDACAVFLASEPDDEDLSTWRAMERMDRDASGYLPYGPSAVRSRRCALCDALDATERITASPFSQCPYVSTCVACHHKVCTSRRQ